MLSMLIREMVYLYRRYQSAFNFLSFLFNRKLILFIKFEHSSYRLTILAKKANLIVCV